MNREERSELFLEYEAAGWLDLEPAEREALMGRPKPKVKAEPPKVVKPMRSLADRGGRGNKKPWVDPTCRSCGEQFPAPKGTRRTLCPSCLAGFRTAHSKATLHREAAGVAA